NAADKVSRRSCPVRASSCRLEQLDRFSVRSLEEEIAASVRQSRQRRIQFGYVQRPDARILGFDIVDGERQVMHPSFAGERAGISFDQFHFGLRIAGEREEGKPDDAIRMYDRFQMT